MTKGKSLLQKDIDKLLPVGIVLFVFGLLCLMIIGSYYNSREVIITFGSMTLVGILLLGCAARLQGYKNEIDDQVKVAVNSGKA